MVQLWRKWLLFLPRPSIINFSKKKSIDIDLIVDERFSAVPVRFQCNYSSSLLITIDNYHRKKSINTNSIFGLWTSAVTVQFQCNFHWRLQFFFSLYHFFLESIENNGWCNRKQTTNDRFLLAATSPPPSISSPTLCYNYCLIQREILLMFMFTTAIATTGTMTIIS